MDDNARRWSDISVNGLIAAESIADASHRDALSRVYYAGFHATTGLLHHAGLTPPTVDGTTRQAWSHQQTPEMVETSLSALIRQRELRKKLGMFLRLLYGYRIIADYTCDSEVDRATVNDGMKKARYIVRTARQIILEGSS